MKTAIYIESGTIQLVITPETAFEKDAVRSLIPDHASGDRLDVAAQVFRGSFYDCRGGWVRQSTFLPHHHDPFTSDEVSLIIRTAPKREKIDV